MSSILNTLSISRDREEHLSFFTLRYLIQPTLLMGRIGRITLSAEEVSDKGTLPRENSQPTKGRRREWSLQISGWVKRELPPNPGGHTHRRAPCGVALLRGNWLTDQSGSGGNCVCNFQVRAIWNHYLCALKMHVSPLPISSHVGLLWHPVLATTSHPSLF